MSRSDYVTASLIFIFGEHHSDVRRGRMKRTHRRRKEKEPITLAKSSRGVIGFLLI
jgi:hypothetical protein